MKKMLAMGLMATALALTACNNPPVPAYQAHDLPMQVSMSPNGWIQQDIRVSKVNTERIGAGQLKVTLELYNNTNHDLSVDYKYNFTDKNGVGVETQTGWQFIKVPPRGFQAFSFTSLSPVEDFRVQLRPAE